MIQIDVFGANAVIRKEDVLTTGMVGAPVIFSFDSAWDGLSKAVVYRCGGVTKDEIGIVDTGTIPYEVLHTAGLQLEIGVYGVSADGATVIPTVWVKTNRVQSGADPSGEEGFAPTPSDWEQMIAIAGEAKKIAQSVRTDADSGAFAGPQGPQGEQGIQGEAGPAGEDGHTPVNGVDYFTDADKAALVDAVLDDLQPRVEDLQKQVDDLLDDTTIGPAAWSSLKTVDALCPAFAQSGAVVRCEPVAGYPLAVSTILPASEEGYPGITLTQQGKNLYNKEAYPFSNIYISKKDGSFATSTGYVGTRDYIDISHLQGQNITLNHPAKETGAGNPGAAFYDANKVFISGSGEYVMNVPANAVYLRFSVPAVYKDGASVQIELGSAVTEYEPYRERVFSEDFPEPVTELTFDWPNVTAFNGVNTFHSSYGSTRVEGKADPVAIIEKLTNAIISMGGNI